MKNNIIPDVTAFPLDQALNLLEKHSVSYYVKKALPFRPPGKSSGKVENKELQPTVYRVIRQVEGKEGVVELVVAPEAAAE